MRFGIRLQHLRRGTILKRLLIIGTGGTIAGVAPAPGNTVGYRAGDLPIDQILDTVPTLSALGQLQAKQFFSMASERLTSEHWLFLAHRLRETLHGDSPPDAIVLTHGSDTLEETAFFLSLTLPASLPVVLTGAMRPATALNADGPGNLFNACRFGLAAHETGIGGTFVCFNEHVFRADQVMKVHANQSDAFKPRFGRPVGWLENGAPHWARLPPGRLADVFAQLPLPEPARLHADGSIEAPPTGVRLPKVALIQQHVDCDEALVDWHLSRGCQGLVLAGTGIGTMPVPMRAALARARQRGCLIVRSSRIPAGHVGRNTEADPADSDEALSFITTGWLDPLKARILLQLGLHAGIQDPIEFQALFDRSRPD